MHIHSCLSIISIVCYTIVIFSFVLSLQLSEIRHKALEYRQRSEGYHFGPTHSSWRPHNAKTGDQASLSPSPSPSLSHSSGVSPSNDAGPISQNGAHPHTSHKLHHEQPSHPHPTHSSPHHPFINGGLRLESVEGEEGESGGSEGDGDTGSSVSESEDEENNSYSGKNDNQQSRTLPLPESGHHEGRTALNGNASSPLTPDQEEKGRVPTPILGEASEQMRHHLDRTTPTLGAVLTSPPLPDFRKPSRSTVSSTATTRTRERKTGKQKRATVHSSRPARVNQHEGKSVSQPRLSGLHLSRGSPKLKRDPSLVSSVAGNPRSASSHRHTLPTSHPPKTHHTSRPHLSTLPLNTRHTLPTAHPSPPPSTISSLLSTVSDQSSIEGIRKLNYSTSNRSKPVNPVRLGSTQHHTHTGCTSAKCDICGAWLRKSQGFSAQRTRTNGHTATGTRGLNFSQVAPLAPRTHQYKGPVTQLSHSHRLASHTGDHSTPGGLNSNIRPDPQPRGLNSNISPDPQPRGLNTNISPDPQLRGPNSNIHPDPLLRGPDSNIHPGPQLWGSNSNIRPGPQLRGSGAALSPGPQTPPMEPDELSLSSLTLSSCSAASDLLKKARDRRQRFWTQPTSL